MKLSILLSIFANNFANAQDLERPDFAGLERRQRPSSNDKVGDSKRYSDMKEIAEHIFNGGGSKFDEKQYWTYGCHCLFLGDRPLTDMGKGTPVDDLDRACRVYKDCQRCVRDKHGNQCIGEFVKYTWRIDGPRDVQSSEKTGSCPRELFECDRQFALNMFQTHAVYKTKFHQFFGKWDHNDRKNCPRGPGGPHQRKCCGGNDQPYVLFNAKKQNCCRDGIPRKTC